MQRVYVKSVAAWRGVCVQHPAHGHCLYSLSYLCFLFYDKWFPDQCARQGSKVNQAVRGICGELLCIECLVGDGGERALAKWAPRLSLAPLYNAIIMKAVKYTGWLWYRLSFAYTSLLQDSYQ